MNLIALIPLYDLPRNSSRSLAVTGGTPLIRTSLTILREPHAMVKRIRAAQNRL